jgi:hypothetical protein
MTLEPQCPRCPGQVTVTGTDVRCPNHEQIAPLWRAATPSYESFTEHLVLSRPLPTWLPWPMPAGWQITDFGCVNVEGGTPQAAFASCAGSSELDGPVELTVVTEEPGVGLGARVGGVVHSDPGAEVAVGPAALHLRVEEATLPLWSVSTADDGEALDRAVVAGEAAGRWLWVVVRPASALLLLRDVGPLTDLSHLGPPLVDTPFGSLPRSW